MATKKAPPICPHCNRPLEGEDLARVAWRTGGSHLRCVQQAAAQRRRYDKARREAELLAAAASFRRARARGAA